MVLFLYLEKLFGMPNTGHHTNAEYYEFILVLLRLILMGSYGNDEIET
jgi:hypothetical protein